MYIWLLNSSVKFHAKISTHCWNINKIRRGATFLCSPCICYSLHSALMKLSFVALSYAFRNMGVVCSHLVCKIPVFIDFDPFQTVYDSRCRSLSSTENCSQAWDSWLSTAALQTQDEGQRAIHCMTSTQEPGRISPYSNRPKWRDKSASLAFSILTTTLSPTE